MKNIESFKSQKVNETMIEAKDLLTEYKKALILRPTGFGKSYILAHIGELIDKRKIIYFYPRDIIRTETQEKYEDVLTSLQVEFYSYHWLRNMQKVFKSFKNVPQLMGMENGLFIFDEAHFVGAELWGKAVKQLQKDFPDAMYLGATATPNRPDGSEFRWAIFDGQEVSRYTLCNALDDGLYKSPKYVYCMSEVEKFVNDEKSKVKKAKGISEVTRSEVLDKIDKYVVENSIFTDNATIIHNNMVEEFGEDLDYIKAMIFFPTYNALYTQLGELKRWFKEAFPKLRLNTVLVGSKPEMSKGIERLQHLKKRSGIMDLIVSIDMLSYGIHTEDVNCVCMLRNTCSDTIYLQQLGRALSIDNDNSAVIFDFVGNLNRRQYYGKFGSKGRVIDNPKSDSEWEGFSQRVRSVDNVKELMEIARIADIEQSMLDVKWVNAVLYKHCPKELAMSRLGLNSLKDLDKVIERYRVK